MKKYLGGTRTLLVLRLKLPNVFCDFRFFFISVEIASNPQGFCNSKWLKLTFSATKQEVPIVFKSIL